MQARFFRRMGAAAVGCVCALLFTGGAHAQAAAALPDAPQPGKQTSSLLHPYHPPTPTSRVEVYGGYSYFHPVEADINGFSDAPIDRGSVFGANYYFNRWIGAQVEGTLSPHGRNDCAATAQAGPVLRFPGLRRAIPFVHATAGGAKLGGPVFQPCTWGWGLTGGTGFDFLMPGLGDHLAIRPVQADYEFNHVDYGPLVLPGGYAGGTMKMNAYRLSSGVVLRFGNMTPAPPATLACSVTPAEVFPGESIAITARTTYIDPHRKSSYIWNTTGGVLSGGGDSVTIATDNLPAGDYVVTGKVIQGPRLYQQAACTTKFTVKKVITPPQVSCSASPAAVNPGGTSTIHTVATAQDNRPLTYSYKATRGAIEGDSATATLNTAGVATGTITVTCTATDNLGKSASATTSVQIIPAELPPAPRTQALCSIAFNRDAKRPARVDNEAKGCLDDIALTMQRQSDSKLVIVGSRVPSEVPSLAAERAINTKLYLTHEKGIDPARISIRTGGVDARSAFNTLVPPGATFEQGSSFTVNEGEVKPTSAAYGVPRAKPAPKKKAVKK